nr:trimeric autotransporter adhesin [Candidatus Cloacimonadota bacterium]
MKRITLILTLCIIASISAALISDYYGPPVASEGTYTEITGNDPDGFDGNVTDEELSWAIPLGFTFNYCGVDYTQAKLSTNGYLAMGTDHEWFYSYENELSSTNSQYYPFIAPLWDDLQCDDMTYLTTGTAPNRVFTAQWKNAMWDWNGSPVQNFQLKLYETSNKIEFIYGPLSTPNNPSATIGINVGPGGPGNFYSITPGATITYSTTVENSSISSITYLTPGTTYTFETAPPRIPDPAVLVSPGDGESSVQVSTDLMWTSGGGIPTGYRLFFGTDGAGTTPPTTIANNVDLGNVTSYDPATDLDANTTYYWQVIPYNDLGSASDCPIWSFTTSGLPLRGEKTIDPAGSGADNFTSFAAAITALNSVGVGQDGVIFNVPAGLTFNETASLPPITTTGSEANPISFVKSGTGANPIVTAPGTAGTTDYIFKLNGADYITFDGIDVSNATGATNIEYGYWLTDTGTNGGSSHNVIKNCTINLDRANSNSSAVYTLATYAQNNDNLFQNITVNNTYNGIWIAGMSSLADENNVVEGCTFNDIAQYNIKLDYQTGMQVFDNVVNYPSAGPMASSMRGLDSYELSNSSVYNNTFSGGNVTGMLYNIFCNVPGELEIHHNTISGTVTTSTWWQGIYINLASWGTVNLHHNEIHDIQAGMIFSGIYTFRGYNLNINDNQVYNITCGMIFRGLHIIENVSLDSPSNIYNNVVHNIELTGQAMEMATGINVQDRFANVYNNMVYDLRCPNSNFSPWDGSPQIAGISLKDMQASQGERGYVYNNTVLLDAPGDQDNASTACFYTSFSGPVDLKNNVFVNLSTPGANGKTAAFWKAAATFDNFVATMDKNIYYAGIPDSTHLIYCDSENSAQTLADYQALNVGKDQNSYTENVPFISNVAPYDLHIDPTVPTYVESNGIYLPTVLIDDIDGDIRNNPPDLGADEGDFTAYTGGEITTPENVTIILNGENIEISWDAVDGAAGYYIYGSDEVLADTPWGTPLMTVDAPNTSAVLSPSSHHKFYYVTAFD